MDGERKSGVFMFTKSEEVVFFFHKLKNMLILKKRRDIQKSDEV